MPLCGFDKQMLDGLGMFYAGLAEAVIRKAKEKNITAKEAILQELQDMNDFLKELIILGKEIEKQRLLGITNYARSFYFGSLKRAEQEKINIQEAMDIEIKETRKFLYEIDNYFYEYLEGKNDSMKQLVKWINKNLGGKDATIRI